MRSVKLYGNLQLRQLPTFGSASFLALTYAYHCCDYLEPRRGPKLELASGESLAGQLLASIWSKLRRLLGAEEEQRVESRAVVGSEPSNSSKLSELVLWPPNRAKQVAELDWLQLWAGSEMVGDSNLTHLNEKLKLGEVKNAHLIDELEEPPREEVKQIRLARALNHRTQTANYNHQSDNNFHSATCLPEPNAFLPCQDLFDSWWQRAGIWSVFLLGFTGNILVIVVLSSVRQSSSSSALTSIMWLAHSKRHIDVPRFLVINLAVADLLMALYLGLLAFIDLSTLGEFRMFAIKWQYSNGCKLASFLGVLSSELSVFILAIITLERNYAITNAVHLNRRLSLQKAMLIMLLGYLFAILMAVLPLNGVSDYRKFSICLPLDMSSSLASQIYLTSLLLINSFSFVLLLSCYLRMYCAIRGSQAWNTNDLRIAKRMSVLVLTDFLCWSPVIIAAFASLFGYHLIGSDGLKVLTIFILPLNSVANPFLYAITTKKFKRDLDTLAHRLKLARLFTCNQDQPELHQHNNHYNHCRDPKAFAGQRHYRANLISTDKKRNKPKGGSQPQLRELSQDSDRFQRAQLRSQLTGNQVTMNRTSCSCQHPQKPRLDARQLDESSLTRSIQAQPRIVLHSVESAIDVASAPCQLIKASSERSDRASCSYALPIRAGHKAAHLSQSSIDDQVQPADQSQLLQCATDLSQHHLGSRASCEIILNSSSPKSADPDEADKFLGVEPRQEAAMRSVSACGYRWTSLNKGCNQSDRCQEANYNAMRAGKGSSGRLTKSISRLFEPIAKAWSSIQISLNSSYSTARQNSAQFSADQQQTPEMSKRAKFEHELQDADSSDRGDQMNLFASPSHRLQRLQERRMSRSCDLITEHLISPASGSDRGASTSQSDYYDDDQRILLATIDRIGVGASLRDDANNNSLLRLVRAQPFKTSKCTRCRSWSPALLTKLEDCIYQIKSKIPKFNGSRCNNDQANRETMPDEHTEDSREPDSTTSNSPEETRRQPEFGHEDVINELDDYDSDDQFDELAYLEWNQKRDMLAKRYQYSRQKNKLQQQSSTISDTSSTRTGATVMINMSVSFDSSSNIPLTNQKRPENPSEEVEEE